MKYAHLESERRFLLAALPDLDGARELRITDRYVHRSRLRVRLVEEDGQEPVRKLGQKKRLDESAPSVNAHTTLYLDEAEYQLLCALPAAVLRKTRFVREGWAFDVHESGLLLAETEGLLEPDFDVVREVTDDLAYSGGELAKKSTSRLPS
ncbi:MAG: hypothetical protein JWO12_360 [Frankiales bacterium]|nr:hypothetical protein [Frankiales bacterium]